MDDDEKTRERIAKMVAKIKLLRDGGDVAAKLLLPTKDEPLARRMIGELSDDCTLNVVSDQVAKHVLNHEALRRTQDVARAAQGIRLPKSNPSREELRGLDASQKLDYANERALRAQLERMEGK